MSKNEPKVETIHVDAKKQEPVENLPETAIGICKNPNTGVWEVNIIKFNAVTGNAKVVESKPQSDKMEAKHQFQVTAGGFLLRDL